MSPWLFQTSYLSIHMYGFCIATGFFLFLWLVNRDSVLQKYQLLDISYTLITYSLASALVGARLLWFLECWDDVTLQDFIDIRIPGFSLMGAAVGILIALVWMLQKIAPEYRLLLCDRLSLYTPLIIASGRIGCFFAGCCYGTQTAMPWGICYTHPENLAPLGVMLHPAQLYSALFLSTLFFILYSVQNKFSQGQLFLAVSSGIASERFIVDFFRDDRTLVIGNFSLHQVISVVCLIGVFLIVFLSEYVQRKQRQSF